MSYRQDRWVHELHFLHLQSNEFHDNVVFQFPYFPRAFARENRLCMLYLFSSIHLSSLYRRKKNFPFEISLPFPTFAFVYPISESRAFCCVCGQSNFRRCFLPPFLTSNFSVLISRKIAKYANGEDSSFPPIFKPGSKLFAFTSFKHLQRYLCPSQSAYSVSCLWIAA